MVHLPSGTPTQSNIAIGHGRLWLISLLNMAIFHSKLLVCPRYWWLWCVLSSADLPWFCHRGYGPQYGPRERPDDLTSPSFAGWNGVPRFPGALGVSGLRFQIGETQSLLNAKALLMGKLTIPGPCPFSIDDFRITRRIQKVCHGVLWHLWNANNWLHHSDAAPF